MTGPQALATLIAKDEIRDLALLYSRGVDRQDFALLRTLYTSDGTDDHGIWFKGHASDYVDWLEQSLPHLAYSGHHVCNHLISVEGDEGEGEVYAIAYHVAPDGAGGHIEDLMLVRYCDRYRVEDGRWRFAARSVSFDLRNTRSVVHDAMPAGPAADLSYGVLGHRLFQRG